MALRDVVKAFAPAGNPASVVREGRTDPALVAVLAKRSELQGRLAELRGQRSRLLVELNADEDLGEIRDRRARALLVGEPTAPLDRERVRADVGRIVDEERLIERALELHTPAVERERNRVNDATRAQLRPQHRAIAGRIHAALVELTAALRDEQQFRETLTDADVPLSDLAALPFPKARLDQAYSAASWWLRGARECGAIAD